MRVANYIHGESATLSNGKLNTSIYLCWANMKQRCCNPNHPRWARYGGRGITVCARWVESFKNFYADMGDRPSYKYSLDRVDNDGPYSPENCRWATYTEQQLNSSRPVVLGWRISK